MAPTARIVHNLPERVRFRIDAHKGDREYFVEVAQRLADQFSPERLEANPLTGSLLVQKSDLDVEAVVSFSKKEGLFEIDSETPSGMAEKAVAPLSALSSRLKDLSFGQLDLANVAFFVLIGTGLYQLIRGNLRSPPWYTAFWYAMGIYLKSIADAKKENPVD